MGMFIEVCGSEDFDYKYRDRIYRKNGFYVIFLHSHKDEKQWKKHLAKKIMRIEEFRHDEVPKNDKFSSVLIQSMKTNIRGE